MRIHSMTRWLTSFQDRFSCWCSASARTVPMSRARPSSFNGKTARKSVVSSATCSSPFIAAPARFDVGDIEQMRHTCRRESRSPAPRAPWNARRRSRRCRRPRTTRWRRLPASDRASTRPRASSKPRSSVARSTSTPASAKPIDQQPLVLVLRKDQRIRKWTDTCAHVAEDRARDLLAGRPEIDGEHLAVRVDHRVRECRSDGTTRASAPARPARATSFPAAAVLSTILTRTPSRVSHSARHQTGRSCADDQDLGVLSHRPILSASRPRMPPRARR